MKSRRTTVPTEEPVKTTRTVHKGFRFRLYPDTDEQYVFIAKTFGCQRFIYNYFLSRRKQEWQQHQRSLNNHSCIIELTKLKQEPDLIWLKEMNSQSLQAAVENLDTAYVNFFKRRADYPRYKKKSNRQSVKIKQNFHIENSCLFIPKLKTGIPIRMHRPIDGKPLSCTISKTPCGDFYVSIVCEVELPITPLPLAVERSGIRGYDGGLTHLLTAKDGEVFDNPRFYRSSEKDIAHLNRQFSKKQKGGSNREKARLQLARKHQYIADCRKDMQHKISRSIVDENQVILLETLKLVNLMQNHKLSKAFADASLGELYRQIQYKSDWDGKLAHCISQWYPSSKSCNGKNCGFVMKKLPLNIREWDCPNCNKHHNRDALAADNIEEEGIRELLEMGLIVLKDINCGNGMLSQSKQKLAEAPVKGMERKQRETVATVSKEIAGSKRQEAPSKLS